MEPDIPDVLKGISAFYTAAFVEGLTSTVQMGRQEARTEAFLQLDINPTV